MAEDFDPYRKWLGIPAAEQPPHHYRLLGIGLFERDPDVIEGAADRQMAHVQTYKNGPHSALSQTLLNELAAAKLCLLNGERRAAYDKNLKAQLDAVAKKAAPKQAVKVVAAAPAAPLVAVRSPSAATSKYARKRKNSQQAMLLIGGAALATIALVAIVVVALNGGDEPEQVAQADGDPPENAHGTPPATNGSSASPDARATTPPAANSNDTSRPPRSPGSVQPDAPPSRGQGNGQQIVDDPRDDEDDPSDDGDPSDDDPDDPADPDDASATPPNNGDLTTVGRTTVRLAPPDEATLETVTKLIRETFQDDFDRAKSDEAAQAALADTLFRQGADPADKPENRYVLLREALALAQESNGVSIALASIDTLAEGWDIDALEEKRLALAAMSKKTHPQEIAQEMADALLLLVDEAVAAQKFETADAIAGLARAEATKSRDDDLRDLARERETEVKRLLKQERDAAEAAERLAANPDDAEANLIVGKFRCFVLDEWEAGVPLLQEGGDEGLAQVAMLESGSTDATEQQLALADAWWSLSEEAAAADRGEYEARARHWYEQALPDLAGVDKLRAEKRLAPPEVAATTPAASARGDLHLTRALSRARKATDDGKLVRTPLAGRTDRGEAFDDLPSQAGLLVGFTITLRGPNDRREISSIQPLYLTADGVTPGTAHGRVERNPVQIQAQEGYAVAGVTVRGRYKIEGLSVTFMKIKSGELNPKDNYTSEWHGGTQGKLVPVGGPPGKPVVGLFGLAQDFEVNALGLTHLP